jgi:hypothetical protein
MQRSISHQNPVRPLLYVAFFILYSSLSSIYPSLPPMLAVLFVLFAKALDNNDSIYVLIIAFCLVIFEANNGYMLFSSIFYIYLVYKFILPKISQSFSCKICIRVAYIFLSYIGFFLFLTLISNIFLLQSPQMSYYVIYYMLIEFFLVSLL